ncbi:hypothetical protein [Streptomyces sp. Z26]|uniref:hypothetical protein n=1 Tax=Streptomyces sp. Z26 TaxID=2500177 RepID=UPI000EF16A54|nr:hypothetical protein [Streptomyces sp. Z26]RLL66983.1 hypothetical protein D7M15_09020 [Streptomyces sp. Z26]
MAATGHIPIYMRIGTGAEAEIGYFVINAGADCHKGLTTSHIAEALRSVADVLESPEPEQGVHDAP